MVRGANVFITFNFDLVNDYYEYFSVLARLSA